MESRLAEDNAHADGNPPNLVGGSNQDVDLHLPLSQSSSLLHGVPSLPMEMIPEELTETRDTARARCQDREPGRLDPHGDGRIDESAH